jgi:hypothetical protein
MTSSNSNRGAGSSSSSRIPSSRSNARRTNGSRWLAPKNLAHRQAIQESQERNIKFKRLLHTNAGDGPATPSSQGGNQVQVVPSRMLSKYQSVERCGTN